MTVQEKLDKIANLKREITEIEDDIRRGKQSELNNFLDEAVGSYVRFKFDETDEVFIKASERTGGSLKGSGIIFYSDGNFETIENDFYIVDIDSEFKAFTEDEWMTIINNKTMSHINYICG